MEGKRTYSKTRIAPTPSGFLHLGNVVSFVRTVGLAKSFGARILLRIDDMDRERVVPEYVQDIFDVLNFLELPWEEGPRNVKEFEREWSQVHRMGMYREALEDLREKGDVFACSCSRAKVMRDSPDGVYAGTCRDKELSF
ncbi:glutamate--tRNA ligase family protein [Puia sp. P3]|uniref:glutamate--tRNA ligase family protein n=1 Tax=Puia sp. P3 TaxID=3423952 RepID=UPI003D67F4CE